MTPGDYVRSTRATTFGPSLASTNDMGEHE